VQKNKKLAQKLESYNTKAMNYYYKIGLTLSIIPILYLIVSALFLTTSLASTIIIIAFTFLIYLGIVVVGIFMMLKELSLIRKSLQVNLLESE